MIKNKVKEVTYQIWEECEECGGKLHNSTRRIHGMHHSEIRERSACEDCGKPQKPYGGDSPITVTEYEEVSE